MATPAGVGVGSGPGGFPALPESFSVLRLNGRMGTGGSWSLGGLVADSESTTWRAAAEFIIEPGSGVMSFSAGYWRMAGFSELDLPSFDVGLGIAKRVQAGASVPVYHAGAPGGPVARGLGDLYLNAKVQLREPSAGPRQRIGVALVPLVQVLSAEPAIGESRVSWGLPVAIEVQRSGWRMYGSTGYFSRGSLFASAAIELPLAGRAWITGTLTQSHSTRADAGADALGLPSNRTDISGGVSWAAANRIALFGSVGRTLSRSHPTDTHLFVNGGVAVTFEGWR